jgi:very-short-patch-repair endonuclease
LCKHNPDKQKTFIETYNENRVGSWNSGLTKENNASLKSASDKLKQKYISGELTVSSPACTKEYWTAERRKEKSAWRKQLHKDFPEMHPNRKLAGNRKKMSYPEKVAYDYLMRHNIVFEHNKKIDKYYPDFVIGNLIIEIDGAQWHDKEKDKNRDAVLEAHGYQVFRIDSKENIEGRIKEILSV